MTYLVGIDGGGSKTHCIIGDCKGNILAEGASTGSNYQTVGTEAARSAINSAIVNAMDVLGITCNDIDYFVFGLAGADTENDYKVLNNVCKGICGHERFRVLNDTWIGLRAGTPENWGIVTICGTGGACSGRNREGREVTLRNLTYEAGNRGGGSEIVQKALHHAYRSEEKTGRKTRLEYEIPRLMDRNSMDDLLDMVIERIPDTRIIAELPVLVCRLANEGDIVCQDILIDTGHALGEIAGGVTKRLGMENEAFNVALVGGVFKTNNPLLVDEYTTTLHRTAPYARIGVVCNKPVIGAYYLALDWWKTSTL
jgi:Predicted N-acetylglucosamine kinase